MALRTTSFLDSATYGAEWLRLMLEMACQEGVWGANDMDVTPAAAGGMRVDIAAGVALVKGDSGTPGTGISQGLYMQVNDASIANAVTLTAAHASLPRIDQIILQLNDSSDLGSGSNTPAFSVVTGTATSGATLDNRTGAAALPNNALRLADILVPAASSSVTAGNVRDRRPWARGAHMYLPGTKAGNYTQASGVVSSILSGRIELSGAPVLLTSYAEMMPSAVPLGMSAQIYVTPPAGAATLINGEQVTQRGAASDRFPLHPADTYVPSAAGSHLFELRVGNSGGTTSSTLNAAGEYPWLDVREGQPNANNN